VVGVEEDRILGLGLEGFPSAYPFVHSCVAVVVDIQEDRHQVVELNMMVVAVVGPGLGEGRWLLLPQMRELQSRQDP
jgi:hypothetical protein